jgi:hypothetical protein
MRRFGILYVLKAWVIVAVAVAVFGFGVMFLWNGLLPELFGWKEIGFVQAIGLLVLSKILFSGFRGPWGGWGRHRHMRMLQRWESMTPEEREKFRAGMHGHCGHRGYRGQGDGPEKATV